jgi:HSP20 family molecular chaperone IbpA
MSTVSIERIRHLNGEKPQVFTELEETIGKIQQMAFNLFEQRGELSGLDLDDWLQAEHEVLGSAWAELVESDKELKLRVPIPGVDSKDVMLTATPESLIVQANASHRYSAADGEIRFCEFSEDKLCRQFGLASPIDVNSVSASLDKRRAKRRRGEGGQIEDHVKPVEAAKPWKEMFT